MATLTATCDSRRRIDSMAFRISHLYNMLLLLRSSEVSRLSTFFLKWTSLPGFFLEMNLFPDIFLELNLISDVVGTVELSIMIDEGGGGDLKRWVVVVGYLGGWLFLIIWSLLSNFPGKLLDPVFFFSFFPQVIAVVSFLVLLVIISCIFG